MSLTDVGLQFKMTGAENFQSKMQELGSAYKNLSSSMDKAPNVDKHFKAMADAAHAAANKINTSFKLIGAGIAALATAKGLGAGFDWAIGSSEMSRAMGKVRMAMSDQEVAAYQAAAEKMRETMVVDKPGSMDAAYQINSAAANKPLEERLEIYKLMPHYAKLLNMNLEEAALFFKGINASFGQFLSPDKQKSFPADLLGAIQGANKDTAADPKKIAEAFGHAAPVYQELGLNLKHMTADMAFLIPALGNRAEMAGVALRNIYSRAGASFGKLQGAEAGGAFIEKYLPQTPWRSMKDLEFAASSGNRQAKRFLENMKANEAWYTKQGKDIAGALAKQGNWDELFSRMYTSAQAIKKQKGDAIGKLKDALGEETMVPLLSLLKAYHDGKMAETRKAVSVSGAEAQSTIENRGMNDVYQKWGLVKQAAEGLAWNLREIVQAPLDTLLTTWKESLLEYKKLLGGAEKSGAIAKGVKGFFAGAQYGYVKETAGQDAADQQGSIDDAIKKFIQSLETGGWRDAGVRLGQAIGAFGSAAKQFAEIVAYLHSWLPKKDETSKTPEQDRSIGGGLWALAGKKLFSWPGAIAGWLGGKDWIDSPWGKTLAGAAGGFGLGGVPGLFPGAVGGATWAAAPILASGLDAYSSANSPLGPGGLMETMMKRKAEANSPVGPVEGNFSGKLESNITINIDGQEVVNAVEPKLIDKVKGIVERLFGSNLDNATGAMWR